MSVLTVIFSTWLHNYKPADYITICKTSTVLTNAMLMINTEATHTSDTTLLDDAQTIR